MTVEEIFARGVGSSIYLFRKGSQVDSNPLDFLHSAKCCNNFDAFAVKSPTQKNALFAIAVVVVVVVDDDVVGATVFLFC